MWRTASAVRSQPPAGPRSGWLGRGGHRAQKRGVALLRRTASAEPAQGWWEAFVAHGFSGASPRLVGGVRGARLQRSQPKAGGRRSWCTASAEPAQGWWEAFVVHGFSGASPRLVGGVRGARLQRSQPKAGGRRSWRTASAEPAQGWWEAFVAHGFSGASPRLVGGFRGARLQPCDPTVCKHDRGEPVPQRASPSIRSAISTCFGMPMVR